MAVVGKRRGRPPAAESPATRDEILAAALALVASAPAMGAAEAVVDLYRQRLTDRVLAYTLGERAKEQPVATPWAFRCAPPT
jgi:hypothetical protein